MKDNDDLENYLNGCLFIMILLIVIPTCNTVYEAHYSKETNINTDTTVNSFRSVHFINNFNNTGISNGK
jgi:hypothetical protein